MNIRKWLAIGAIALAPLAAADAGAETAGRAADLGRGVVPVGSRYVIHELYQANRDLNVSDPHVNVLFDTRSGRSWVLRYARLPGGNEMGYVWVEIPLAAGRR